MLNKSKKVLKSPKKSIKPHNGSFEINLRTKIKK